MLLLSYLRKWSGASALPSYLHLPVLFEVFPVKLSVRRRKAFTLIELPGGYCHHRDSDRIVAACRATSP